MGTAPQDILLQQQHTGFAALLATKGEWQKCRLRTNILEELLGLLKLKSKNPLCVPSVAEIGRGQARKLVEETVLQGTSILAMQLLFL